MPNKFINAVFLIGLIVCGIGCKGCNSTPTDLHSIGGSNPPEVYASAGVIYPEYKITFALPDKMELERYHNLLQATTEEAVRLWNQFLGVNLFVVGVNKETTALITFKLVPELESTEERYGEVMAKVVVRDYVKGQCEVWITPEGAEKWKVIAHEMGHCLGFNHTENVLSLMYPNPAKGSFTQQMIDIVLTKLNNKKGTE